MALNQKKKNKTYIKVRDKNIEISTTIDSAIDKVFHLFDRMGKVFAKCIKPINNATVNMLETINPGVNVFKENEQKVSAKMADFICFIDSSNDQIELKGKTIFLSGINKVENLLDYTERNKKRVLTFFGASVAAITIILLAVGSVTAYEYVYNGKVLGVVKDQEDVYKTVDIIGDKLSRAYHAEINIDPAEDITFRRVLARNREIDDKEDVLNRLTFMKDMKAKGYGIFVNGNRVAVLDSKSSAKSVLEEMKSRYIKDDEGINYKKIGFSERVAIEEVDTKLGNIQNKDDVLEYMLTGATEKKIHLVKQGETLSAISKLYGIKQSELVASNPGLNPDKLQIDQEISLTQAVPVATVQTVEVATYKEAIPFEIAYENTKSMYKGEQTVKSRGSDGEKQVTAEIVRNNGIEASRKELDSVILAAPVAQTVLVGTKDLPPLVGTGNFIYPVRGRLSSGYGTRWGRLHSGIDLAASKGTKIIAADGGKVIEAGYNGSLGYCIKINHGGGKVSVYGHCSKLFVKAGEKVYQGQHIANVGNTGRSTGPHLHFEILVNGKTKNPLNYL